ncbi:hypothetical protein BJ166DRAFT_492404 [Pestalotiopsis sp. NC0098]|nr:hypothetical protein BJ166DRAFT_492404 [Pestalotiopsis sp. NC0098]
MEKSPNGPSRRPEFMVGHGEESRVAGYRQLRLRSFSRVQEWLDQRSDRSTGSVLKRQALRPGAEKADNAEFGYLIVHIRMVQVAVAHPSAYRWRFCCRGWPWLGPRSDTERTADAMSIGWQAAVERIGYGPFWELGPPLGMGMAVRADFSWAVVGRQKRYSVYLRGQKPTSDQWSGYISRFRTGQYCMGRSVVWLLELGKGVRWRMVEVQSKEIRMCKAIDASVDIDPLGFNLRLAFGQSSRGQFFMKRP